jgi:Fe-S cluster biogenesis protein NfuA
MPQLSAEERLTIGHRVNETLQELRPFLEADGGDITLEEVTRDGVVRVRLHGACRSCSMSPMTLRSGVEEAIKRVVPAVRSVEAVDLVPS